MFCDIVAGHAPASILFQDERTITFLDHRPVTPGHMLVVPRRHAAFLADLDPEDGAQLFRVGLRGAAALRASPLRCEGVNFHLADGEVAGQEVFHVHLHVLPRFTGDGFGLRFPPDYRIRERAELDEAAAAVREGWS
ncbi:MAG TPA: HIT family protein [Gaiellaceae bacterium]|nr:HIT family protein [Gaiellaceae bacterium]